VHARPLVLPHHVPWLLHEGVPAEPQAAAAAAAELSSESNDDRSCCCHSTAAADRRPATCSCATRTSSRATVSQRGVYALSLLLQGSCRAERVSPGSACSNKLQHLAHRGFRLSHKLLVVYQQHADSRACNNSRARGEGMQ
jgi:hypothetical protein